MIRRGGVISAVALSSFLLCGATAPTSCTPASSGNDNIGPSKGEVVGAAVGVVAVLVLGTVVIVEVNKSHHRLKGCVSAGPNGLELRDSGNQKVYSLTGITANVKVGDVIQVHGSKQKDQKHSSGAQDFKVEKMSRDYGPCQASLAAAPSSTPPSTP
jgi:hypothetical protein